MVEPSTPERPGLRCGIPYTTGARKGQNCIGLILTEGGDVLCLNKEHHPRHLLDVLEDALVAEIVNPEQVRAVLDRLQSRPTDQKEREEPVTTAVQNHSLAELEQLVNAFVSSVKAQPVMQYEDSLHAKELRKIIRFADTFGDALEKIVAVYGVTVTFDLLSNAAFEIRWMNNVTQAQWRVRVHLGARCCEVQEIPPEAKNFTDNHIMSFRNVMRFHVADRYENGGYQPKMTLEGGDSFNLELNFHGRYLSLSVH